MISDEIRSIKELFEKHYTNFGEITYRGQNLLNLTAVLRDIEEQVKHLEKQTPSDTQRNETKTNGNVVNLGHFRQTKQGDAA